MWNHWLLLPAKTALGQFSPLCFAASTRIIKATEVICVLQSMNLTDWTVTADCHSKSGLSWGNRRGIYKTKMWRMCSLIFDSYKLLRLKETF